MAVGHGKAMRARFRAKPDRMIAAAFSTGIRNGIGKSFASVMGVTTKPGMMTLTPIPSGERAPRRPSPHTLTAAFDPQ